MSFPVLLNELRNSSKSHRLHWEVVKIKVGAHLGMHCCTARTAWELVEVVVAQLCGHTKCSL